MVRPAGFEPATYGFVVWRGVKNLVITEGLLSHTWILQEYEHPYDQVFRPDLENP